MRTLELPRLVGSQKTADQLVDELLGDGPLTGEDLCVSFRENRTATETFTRRLVARLLVEEAVGRIMVRWASDQKAEEMVEAARTHGLAPLVSSYSEDGWVALNDNLTVRCICPDGAERCTCGSAERDRHLAARRRGM